MTAARAWQIEGPPSLRVHVATMRATHADRAEIAAAILAREAREPGLRVSNAGGWHSMPDALTWRQPALERAIEDLVDETSHGIEGVVPAHAWANVMRRGAWQYAHRHGEAAWSAVLYIDAGAPDHGGAITFAQGHVSHTIRPVSGQVLVFPGGVLHSVSEYRGGRPRISLALNLLRAGLQLGEPLARGVEAAGHGVERGVGEGARQRGLDLVARQKVAGLRGDGEERSSAVRGGERL
jgi:hypothetical protein